MAVEAENKYCWLIFSIFAKKPIMRQKQDYYSSMLYANDLRNFHQSQQNLPFQNKRSSDDFVLGF